MTPAGLFAPGSVRCTTLLLSAIALWPPNIRTNAPTAPPTNVSLMATNVDQPSTSDVANSLLFGGSLKVPSLPEGGGHRSEEGGERTSIWVVLAPTVLVLALLLLA